MRALKLRLYAKGHAAASVTTQAHEGIETLRSAQCQRFRGGIQCLYPAKKYGALTVPFCFQALKR